MDLLESKAEADLLDISQGPGPVIAGADENIIRRRIFRAKDNDEGKKQQFSKYKYRLPDLIRRKVEDFGLDLS